jgi:energy-converting hydrogenase Eha subunit F
MTATSRFRSFCRSRAPGANGKRVARDPLSCCAQSNLPGPKAIARFFRDQMSLDILMGIFYHSLQNPQVYFPRPLVQVMLKPELFAPFVGIP